MRGGGEECVCEGGREGGKVCVCEKTLKKRELFLTVHKHYGID